MKVFARWDPAKSGSKTRTTRESELSANANRNRRGVARLTTPIGRGSASGNPLRNRNSR